MFNFLCDWFVGYNTHATSNEMVITKELYHFKVSFSNEDTKLGYCVLLMGRKIVFSKKTISFITLENQDDF